MFFFSPYFFPLVVCCFPCLPYIDRLFLSSLLFSLQHAVADRPLVPLYLRLAAAYVHLKHWEDAMRSYGAALALCPSLPEAIQGTRKIQRKNSTEKLRKIDVQCVHLNRWDYAIRSAAFAFSPYLPETIQGKRKKFQETIPRKNV